MNVIEAIKGRCSVREFLDQSVPDTVIRQVLDTARWAPSGTNTQPWQVAVVSGDARDQICDKINEAFTSKKEPNPDYQYYPKQFKEPYRSRRFACGMALYQALGIDRKDREKRSKQWERNYQGFDAPVELFIFIDADLARGSWLDLGMFIQNVLLAARGHGLETCAQAAMAEYPDVVRDFLDLPNTLQLVCGIAMGYPDTDAAVNNFRTDREQVDEFTKWYK